MRLTFLHRRNFGSLLMALLLPVAAVAVFGPFYQTNDDVAMRLLSEGTFVPQGQPLPFLMHVNVIVGRLLSFAYGLTHALPWYDLLMGAGMTAAAAALLSAWATSGHRLEMVWAFLFAVFFLLPSFVGVQFSLVGLGCAAAGMVMLVRALAEPNSPRDFRLYVLSGTSLLVWGALIRFEGAILMILQGTMVALPFVIAAWRAPEGRPRVRFTVLATFAAGLLIVLSFALNQYVYAKAPGWREFHEYNLRRSRINEYITPERITPEAVQELATQVGWSSTDFTLFRNWFFTDPNLYSLAKVRQAEELFYGASDKPTEESRASRIKRGVELARNFFVEMRLAFLFMLAYVLARGASARLLLFFIGITLMIAVSIAGITLALKAPPDRIFWPMLLLGASILPIASRRWGRPAHPATVAGATLLACYLAGSSVLVLWKQAAERRVATATARQDAEGLKATGATFFVLHGNAFPYEDYWRPLRTESTPFPFVALGVSARTPPVQDSLRRTGRTDLPLSLCTEPGLLIVAPAYIPQLLTTFVAEHHGTAVRFQLAFEGQRLTAWKCITSAEDAANDDASHDQ
jgi:hypothetical protein